MLIHLQMDQFQSQHQYKWRHMCIEWVEQEDMKIKEFHCAYYKKVIKQGINNKKI